MKQKYKFLSRNLIKYIKLHNNFNIVRLHVTIEIVVKYLIHTKIAHVIYFMCLYTQLESIENI